MKRVFVCIGIFVIVTAFACICDSYVRNSVKQTVQLLEDAAECRRNGDAPAADEFASLASENWQNLAKRSKFVLSDLTMVAEVTVSMSRVDSLRETEDTDRFTEECDATILMLKHLLADNKNIGGGS